PTETHFDSLGRPFLVVADNGAAGKYETRTVLDVEGNVLSILDARGNTTQQDYDVVGRPVRTQNPDSGKCVILADVADKPIRAWDDRNQTFRTVYDALQRPTELYLTRN